MRGPMSATSPVTPRFMSAQRRLALMLSVDLQHRIPPPPTLPRPASRQRPDAVAGAGSTNSTADTATAARPGATPELRNRAEARNRARGRSSRRVRPLGITGDGLGLCPRAGIAPATIIERDDAPTPRRRPAPMACLGCTSEGEARAVLGQLRWPCVGQTDRAA